jgi:hypothetical protein
MENHGGFQDLAVKSTPSGGDLSESLLSVGVGQGDPLSATIDIIYR